MEEHSNFLFATVAAFGSMVVTFYEHLAWWLALGAVLVFVDLRFGIKASRARGESVRMSRAWRRTLNKCVDYLAFVTLAEVLTRTFGETIGAPVVSMGMLMIIYGIELSSIFNNYFEYKGLPWRLSIMKLLKGRVKLADAIETEPQESNEKD